MRIRIACAILVIPLGIVGVVSVHMPGSGNMGDWIQWIGHIERRGLVGGYADWVADPASGVPYPPLAGAWLLAASWVHNQFDGSLFLVLRWSLIVSVCVTAILF